MVYRITVLSFTHSALISDRWLAFAFNITHNSFPKRTDSPHSPLWWKHSRYETEQEADFFLSSGVDNSQMWPLQDKVHAPQGRGSRIKNRAERKHVRWVSAISWYVFFLSHTQVFSPGFAPDFLHTYFRKTNSHKRSKQPCGRHMLEMGWFKLINVLWDLFVLLDVWTHLVQWVRSTIAIWWNPGVCSLLIVLSVQSHSCQVSKSGKWYL